MPLSQYDYSEEVGTVTRVMFGILSPERIKEKSVCEVYKHITNYKNLEGTLMDDRLGSTERGKICPTCKNDSRKCPGHFGHMNLAKPIIQIQYYAMILKLLPCFCNRCSSLLINKYDPQNETYVALKSKSGKARYSYATTYAPKIRDCPNCGATQPTYKKDPDGIAKIMCSYNNNNKNKNKNSDEKIPQVMNSEIIHLIFKKISDEDVALVGLNPAYARPEWMLWTIMPVPPPHIRPSVKSETGKVADDDLTHALNNAIKFNGQLREKIETEGVKQSLVEDTWQLLQYHVTTYIDNEITSIQKSTHRSGRPLKAIRQRIKAKEGRVRGNLMGKRVDGSARSVAGADPNLSLDQLGVPQSIAMTLAYPELVTGDNIAQLTQAVRNGPDVYPGAKSFQKKGETKKNLKLFTNRNDIHLTPGDIVYRHIMDNDWVLFNRQPSLHKSSMMAHRARILPWNTFRINVNVTNPYNADFDGDEMNMFVPSTLEAVVELRMLASVPTQIVTPQSSSPTMGMVQDSLLGNYEFTKDVKLGTQDLMRLISWINSYGGKIPVPNYPGPNPRWDSQQFISMFLPQININKKGLVIKGGQMTKGTFDKNTIGTKPGSLFHIAWLDHGPLPTRDLFDNMNNTAKEYLQMKGFTVGLADCVANDGLYQEVQVLLKNTKEKAAQAIRDVNLGLIAHSDPQTEKREFPGKMISLMNALRGEAEIKTQENLKANNAINTMVQCGSKGKPENLVQIISMLGQQEVEGTWITDQYYRRTLPHYHRDNIHPEAHGFIESSFMKGLTPTEYWYHAQAGRVGIISKAIKTAETGYIQRKLVKALEDLRICYDGTVRNANNIIIQTVYGEDGFDPIWHEHQTLHLINWSRARLQREYQHLNAESLQDHLSPESYALFIEHADREEILKEEFNLILEYYTYFKKHKVKSNVNSPINFERLIQNAISKFNADQNSQAIADLDPVYIIRQVQHLRHKMTIDPLKNVNYASTAILYGLMLTNLASKNLIYNYHLNKVSFDYLVKDVYMTFMKCLVNPGENVGIIAAQSLGEPTTQLTLDTFHHTGVGSQANVSRGVPRLREVLGLTRNPKTPSLIIYVKDSYLDQSYSAEQNTNNSNKISQLGADLEYTVLSDVLTRTEIIYDESDHRTCIVEDQEFIDSYYDLLPDEELMDESSPWLLRLEFNREKMMEKHIPLSLVETKLRQFLEIKNLAPNVILSDDNAMKMIGRLRIDHKKNMSPGQDPVNYLRTLEKNIMGVKLKGIRGITRCLAPRGEKADLSLPDGTIISPLDSQYAETAKSYHNPLKFLIDTEGSNLIEVLNWDHIDQYNTVSNNVWEIYEIYGIEAARACLISEINEVLEYAGTYVALRHIELLVDVMTNQGNLVSVDRHGVNKTDSGPLHKASFEETTSQLTNASVYGESDNMMGLSANIMFGQFVPTGTNAFRIGLDSERLKALKSYKPVYQKPLSGIKVSDQVGSGDACAVEDFDFTFKINTLIGQKNEPVEAMDIIETEH